MPTREAVVVPRYPLFFSVVLILGALAVLSMPLGASTPSAPVVPEGPAIPAAGPFLPFVVNMPVPTPFPTATAEDTPTSRPSATPDVTAGPSPDLIWDPRLDRRGTVLIRATVEPGQGYWRLVKALWYDENEPPFAGQHHILVDTLDAGGRRQTGVAVRISSLDGGTEFATIVSEAKPGELYAANYPMYALAPAYRAQPAGSAPADAVSGMGYGCLDNPYFACHTSYGLTWQWVESSGLPAPFPTATATPQDAWPPPNTATPTPTPAFTATPGVPAGLTWDPRLTQRGASLVPAQVAPGQGYWRLVRALWYDVNEPPFQNQGLILVDVLDAGGARQVHVPVRLSSDDGSTTFGLAYTEAKPGEPYAANFGMANLAPAYRAAPHTGPPADAVRGMGLGSLQYPDRPEATRYGLTWQWTVMGR
jgi:hypothetical protein